MKKRLILEALADKIFITVEAEVSADNRVISRKHILLRQDLTPATYEVLQGNFMSVYIVGLGNFFLDQTGVYNDSLTVGRILGVDTSAMTNDELWTELQKL